MTHHSAAKKQLNSALHLDPVTAARLKTAASRQVPANLFRLLMELSPPDPASDIPDAPEGEDQGPPWDEDIEPAADTAA